MLPKPSSWWEPCSAVECTLHQISPYIGKLKSTIAGNLIEAYSRPNDLVVDPFVGSGTIALEAALRGRRVFSADVSPYAKVLSLAKLRPPSSLAEALDQARETFRLAQRRPLRPAAVAPSWVRKFFHPKTLSEIISFAEVCRKSDNNFLLGCVLGILHHERPGFLSYPSSHLVPYLRSRKYPRAQFPLLYRYRELAPRIEAKIIRVYKRFGNPGPPNRFRFVSQPIETISLPNAFDALITSPPYMNALDYGRDNRLRLWLIDPSLRLTVDTTMTQRRWAFVSAITSLAQQAEKGLRRRGYCVIVVGEVTTRKFRAHPSEVVVDVFAEQARSLKLAARVWDKIPDIRRARRECRGVKRELFLTFQKN